MPSVDVRASNDVRVVSLGSGSSGNAVLVQTGRTAVLVDAGMPVRTLTSRLAQVGVTPRMLSAVLLTHEHSDHACGAVAFATRHELPLVADPRTLAAVLAIAERAAPTSEPTRSSLPKHVVDRTELAVGAATKLHDLQISSFPISHDAVAPCGYVLTTGAWRVCVVTDTGVADGAMLEAMRGAHLLVIEANHDRQRLVAGPYPWSLKQRILSPTGHLSNEQTGEALIRVLDDSPCWVWLAHLSRTNNSPDLARSHVRERLLRHGLRHIAVQVAPPGVGPIWDSATLWQTGTPASADVASPTPVAIGTVAPTRPRPADTAL